MLKFLQSIFALPTKIQLINDLNELIEDNQELIADNYQLMAENDELKRDIQQIIHDNYQLSQNFEQALLKIQGLQEQLIRFQSPQTDTPLTLDETFDAECGHPQAPEFNSGERMTSNELETIEQLVQEFNR